MGASIVHDASVRTDLLVAVGSIALLEGTIVGGAAVGLGLVGFAVG